MNALLAMSEKTYRWLDERLGIGMVTRATLLHQVPRSVNWWYVFGSAVLTLFIFQIVTGMFLAMTYVPSPDHAYASLNYISHHQLFGNVLRGLHYWGASAMVLLIFIHMTANFLYGSYKYPRELQWITGSILLILTITMAFTGQLLRWNQDAYWAIVVGAEQAARTPFIGTWVAQLLVGGQHVNGATLTQIYAVHIWLVPGAMLTFIGVHLYLVIYKGISEWPVPGKPVDPKTYWAEYQEILHKDGEPFFPVAISKDAIFNLLVIATVVALAIFVGGQALGPQANPLTPANPRPDWYLIWDFAILASIPPAATPWVIIFFPAVAFGILFVIPLANKGERHFSRRPWAVAIAAPAGIATLFLILIGYQEPWKPVLTLNKSETNVLIPTLPKQNYQGLSLEAQKGAQLMHVEACLACHKVGSVGGLRGPDLSAVGDRLTADQLTWRILRGGGGMPTYGNVLKPAQLNELVAFLETRSANKPQQAAGPGSSP
jgi:ubiquinol-cytochrome c reductase cytochrome b subunit